MPRDQAQAFLELREITPLFAVGDGHGSCCHQRCSEHVESVNDHQVVPDVEVLDPQAFAVKFPYGCAAPNVAWLRSK